MLPKYIKLTRSAAELRFLHFTSSDTQIATEIYSLFFSESSEVRFFRMSPSELRGNI